LSFSKKKERERKMNCKSIFQRFFADDKMQFLSFSFLPFTPDGAAPILLHDISNCDILYIT